ncbi:ABC transporter ATP-binding protein [Trinickia caryophylli]|uniref:Putative spermidine/putrescine transport system ATP-binding protein n=1 Tax=Trinickia caryophylli TaxID=28094 RepID=A0A1X7DHY4_TRICW|nr:ABC transporter ATP-binding protein [Trinickia caryophylli]PMS12312.1 ABC transporter ATP-binding protein [Trinickia caryophylli]TRX17016.1 ABC transporter ATP-binding protein [Trinickia caryophylli]WQE12244.1 ABC transporter ATP-binding protein [Trinickia caryophylli]SMF15738.1 putative spermidine/putrescine transport system ATP-binding protein [Trinickia caryophylli]GLU31614.1 ABC transporter ATP-binding protein [Trinickia caryophylli]
MTFLHLENVSKRYGEFHAVQGLSLDVERGEFVSLLGPSGCGKTTTLQMIAGFAAPSEGRILLDGHDITSLAPEKRGMGVVFQSYALFPHMTVAENVGFGLEMRKMPRPRRAERIRTALAMVHLNGLEARYPRELSGGQRQRVAIARALVIEPRVLLLDEPMSNLDAKLREEMHIELRAIQRQLGITTILVTHDQVEAMTMSDRIAVMHGGRIVQIAAPFDAYERPVSTFASTFLGRTNALEGKVVERHGRCCVVRLGAQLARIAHGERAFGENVHVYVRPEKLRFASNGEAALDGHVRTRLFLGNHWMLEIDSALGVFRMSQPNIGLPPPIEGEAVRIAWSDEDLHMLDTEVSHG